MKYIITLTAIALLSACSQSPTDTSSQGKHDSSDEGIYKPGFGDLMASVQRHHAKLWFAISNQNWDLAKFEVHEISEGFEGIEKYQSARSETEKLAMIQPAMTDLDSAIAAQDLEKVKTAYSLLTSTCNDCHKVTNYSFIKIKQPETSDFSNQDFSVD